MKIEIASPDYYSDPTIEAHLSNLEAEMGHFAQFQPKQDAQKEHELNELAFKVKVLISCTGKCNRQSIPSGKKFWSHENPCVGGSIPPHTTYSNFIPL
jgi:hypothetical protein